jgi:predicted dehydrogenase
MGHDGLGVAVVGLGVGEQHARAYVETGRCTLRWVYDLERNKAEQSALRWGAKAADSLEQVLADPGVAVVSIASYDDAHGKQIEAALTAGKHVFAEKPLCRSASELHTIKELWSRQRGRLKLGSNLILRAAPLYWWLKQQVAEQQFGRIFSLDGEYLYGRLHKITHGWRKDIPAYSVLEGGGIHLIDLMLWLTGEKPESVFACGNSICTQGTAFRQHDFVTATLRFPSGLISRITANFGCVHRHQHVLRLYGTRGTLLCDDAGPRFHQTRDPALSASAVNLPTLPATKGDLVGPFVEAILQDRDLSTDTQSFLDGISVCLACHQSLSSQSVAKVEYI